MPTPRHRPLTANMRTALNAARSQPLRRVHDDRRGRPPWPAHPGTLRALVRLGLVVRGEHISRKRRRVETWTITDAGREALEESRIRKGARDTLHAPAGSTRLMQVGEWVERRMPEPDRLTPNPIWAAHGAVKHSAACHAEIDERIRPASPDERYRTLREMAWARGVDVRDDDRVIARRLDAMEAKIRGARAVA